MSTRPIVLDDSRERRLYDHGVVLRLAKYMRGHRRLVAMAMVSIVLYSGTVVALPWLVKVVVDSYVQARDVSAIDLAGAAYLIFATVQMATSYFHNRLNAFVGLQMVQNLRNDAFDHIHRLSMSFFDRNETGRVMSRVQNDTREVEGFVSRTVMSLTDVLSIAGIVAAMFVMSPVLASITLLFVPVLIGVTSIWQRFYKEPATDSRRAFADVNAHLQETISGIRVVQSLNRERDNLRRFTGVANANPKSTTYVIPAKAGIQSPKPLSRS